MEEQEEEDENEDEDEDEEKVTNQPGTARRPKQPAARHPTEVSPKKKTRMYRPHSRWKEEWAGKKKG